jgi:GNAT superfamily N-acetyltransferase
VARATPVEVTPLSVHDAAAGDCLDRYFAELAARFPEGFDRQTDGAAALEDYTPPSGIFLVARLDGRPVGCGALRLLSPGVGEIKRMWVAPEARGRGVGRTILEALEHAARECQLHTVRLDTHSVLAEALRLYRKSGYRDVPAFNANPYARHWFEKALV